MKKLLIFSAGALSLLGCATTLPTTEAEFDKTPHPWAGYSFSEFEKGQALYADHCGKCHKLYRAGDYSEQEWNEILPVMAQRAKIGNTERELIFRYLITEKKKTEKF